MKNFIIDLFKEKHIDAVGFTSAEPYRDLVPRLMESKDFETGFEEQDMDKRVTPRLLMEDAQSIIVVLFPYYVGEKDGNLSNYCYSRDYHLIVQEILTDIGETIQKSYPDFQFQAYADNGPLVDRYLAYMSGLGFFGTNTHLINDKYGTYTFIGYMITNQSFEYDQPLDRSCLNCQKCVGYCPGNAILPEGRVNGLKCRSYLTQKKRDLSPEETSIIAKGTQIFGCDICQQVCPHNRDIAHTPIPQFRENILCSLHREDIEHLSNRAFKSAYGDRAFSWRGKKILLRNIEILKDSHT